VGDYYQTAVPGIFAIGDVINTPLLAHVASREGEIAVEYMAGHNPAPRIDPMAIPGAVYTTPQVASFGLSEKRAEEMEIAYEKASFPYKGVGKAVATEASEGFIKVLFDPATHEILGAHAVGAEATEIIHEILLAKGAELLPADVAGIIHAHPTLSEGVKEAMLAVEGRAIHA
jgi:dihydrolipoamide dehydrogenase